MALCSTCGAERRSLEGPCEKCGASVAKVPELELAVPPRSAPKPPRPRSELKELPKIDLLYDPRGGYMPPLQEMVDPPRVVGPPPRATSQLARSPEGGRAVSPTSLDPDSDARFLADHGEPPRHWLLSPPYAWRVIKRRRELKRAHAARAEEARRVAAEAEDALVAAAEELRPLAEKQGSFADVVSALRRAEELLRMRDRVLSAENEAEMARLAAANARITKLESDLAVAQAEERSAAAELAAVQEAIAKEETQLKRTESELRAALREPSGTRE